MISKKQPESYRTGSGGQARMFIFFCNSCWVQEVPEEKTRLHYETHIYIFDAEGFCYETRHYCHPHYVKGFVETLDRRPDGSPRTIWELVPHGEPPFPKSTYVPCVTQIALDDAQSAEPLEFDKLYAFEILQANQLRGLSSTLQKQAADAAADREARLAETADSLGVPNVTEKKLLTFLP